MPATSAEIIETEGEPLPFKVVFLKDGQVIAERTVATYDGGCRLIDNLLPLLQKHENS